MDSSSDESFLWEKASTGSEDTEKVFSKSNKDQKKINKYLNKRVKQEQEYLLELPDATQLKKNKKKQDNDFENADSSQKIEWDDYVPKKEKKSKKKRTQSSSKDKSSDSICEKDSHMNENKSNLIDDVEETDMTSRKSHKKKKNKKRRLSVRCDSPDIKGKYSEEETEVMNNHEHLKMTKTNEYNNYEPIEHVHSSHLKNSMDKTYTELNSHKTELPDSINNGTSLSITTSQNSTLKKKSSIKPTIHSTPNNIQIQSKSNPSRLLDRIRFEDDPDLHTDESQNSNSTTSYLKKYLNQNENLQQITEGFQHVRELSNDDEIWILKCPHDIDVQKLHNTNLNLDSKSKIKINGETYCGNLYDKESTITVMTSNNSKLIIKNVVANGIIQFRKRLPKLHVQEENYMVNNHTDLIPLPETKCRHPLFGSNYKDAIKVRVHSARLDNNAADMEISTTHEKKKKKKHKKDHSIKPKEEMDMETSHEKSPKIENESDVPVKKAKKRKHTSNDESFEKKSKKIKLEPDSAEAWKSEKAIEENLFNF